MEVDDLLFVEYTCMQDDTKLKILSTATTLLHHFRQENVEEHLP